MSLLHTHTHTDQHLQQLNYHFYFYNNLAAVSNSFGLTSLPSSWFIFLGPLWCMTALVAHDGQHTCVHFRDTWDPFQLNPVGAEKESKQTCFRLAQYLVAVIVGVAVLASAIIAKVGLYTCLTIYL